jgi:hypothetical protein
VNPAGMQLSSSEPVPAGCQTEYFQGMQCCFANVMLCHAATSQASFDPPGLTVSVKKDRAMEPLLQVCVCASTAASQVMDACCSSTVRVKQGRASQKSCAETPVE